MPDLSTEAVRSWFAQAAPRLDPLDAHVVRPIEAHDDVAAALIRFGDALDQARRQDSSALYATLGAAPALDSLRAILAQFGIHRMVRVMAWLGEAPGGEAVIRHLLAGPAGEAQSLRATLDEVARQILVARFFGADRLAALRAACETEFAEAAP